MPDNQKITRRTMILLAVLLSLMLGSWFRFRPERIVGTKNLTIQVTHGDGSVRVFEMTTAAEFLGDALLAGGLVQGDEGQFGLYVKTVDGETADEAKQQYWAYTREGQQVNYGVDLCPIADGEQYEFVLNTGW